MSHQSDPDVKTDGLVQPDVNDGDHVRDLALGIDKKKEKRSLKVDLLILPVLTLLFFFIGLERMSLANAKTVGIDVDLGLQGNQYYLIIMIGYTTLCLTGAPLAMLTRFIPPPQLLSLIMLISGLLGISTAFAHSFAGLITIRLLLGAAEGPLMALTISYLSQFYARGEFALRIGIWYCAIPFAGCVAGLLSFGVFQIKSWLKGWQILFLIEGSTCTAWSIFAFFYLPKSPEQCSFFSAEEKELARIRLLMDGTNEIEEVISFKDAYLPFIQDWRYLVWALLAFGLGVPLASVLNYIPQLTRRLGFGVMTTNLLTAGPFLLNLIFSLCLSFSSDHFRERSIHLAIPLFITSVGCIILTAISPENKAIGYFATFLICAGATVPSPLLSTWYTNNTISQTHRVILAAVMVGIGNSAGLVAGNLYMSKEEAKGYPTATITTAVFGMVTAIGVLVFGMYMRKENARRNKRDGKPKEWGSKDVPTKVLGLGHRADEYRYMF